MSTFAIPAWLKTKKAIFGIGVGLVFIIVILSLMWRQSNTPPSPTLSSDDADTSNTATSSADLTETDKSRWKLMPILKPEKLSPAPTGSAQSPFTVPPPESFTYGKATLSYHPLSDLYVGSVAPAKSLTEYRQEKHTLIVKLASNGITLCPLHISWERPRAVAKTDFTYVDAITDGCLEN